MLKTLVNLGLKAKIYLRKNVFRSNLWFGSALRQRYKLRYAWVIMARYIISEALQ